MSRGGLIIGIIVIVALCLGYIPCFGWSFWFTLPLALVGTIISIAGMSSNDPVNLQNKNQAVIGLILNLVTLIFGFIRWVAGGFFV